MLTGAADRDQKNAVVRPADMVGAGGAGRDLWYCVSKDIKSV